jgi:hypothetical protein
MIISHKHYARVSSSGVVIKVFSDAFEKVIKGDICIKSNADRLCHVNCLDFNSNYKYKVVNDSLVDLTPLEFFTANKPKIVMRKLTSIKQSFESAMATGKFTSTSLGIEVDCRRSANKNDSQNVDGLIDVMTAGDVASVSYVGFSSSVVATLAQLKVLSIEMKQYALSLYTKKWALETATSGATTQEAIDAIVW